MKKALVLGLAIALCMVGFAGFAAEKDAKAKGGDKDTEAVNKVVADWAAAASSGDMDKAMVFFSDKFSSAEYGDKEGLKTQLQEYKDSGYLSDMKITTTTAKTTVDKKKATVTPVECEASFGKATIDLELAKEGGKWMITAMDVTQN